MSNLKSIGAVLAALVVSSMSAHAERDFGNVDCGKWLEHRKGPVTVDQVSDIRWFGGYLSGLNTAWTASAPESQKDPLKGLQSLSQGLAWMDNYCKTNPLETVKSGAVNLFFDLVDRKEKSLTKH